ncbi:MAG: c-type cytochrome [Planctomycetes bacterium]|nr:c-type cytochrome [Planctomycetota bacterium]
MQQVSRYGSWALAVAVLVFSGSGLTRPVGAGETRLGAHRFTLPDGFEIESIAGPPLVDRPITAAFDDQGRLYVADSSGSNDKVEKQLEEKPHRILRLEDIDGDGKFDKSVVFADKMMFPEGTMWLDGSLYVAAPPSIWKLTDTDGDGVADSRVEWFAGKTLTGCANDLHGPYAGPDGWIYWCKGAFAQQTYPRTGKPPLVTRAAHIFRARPDGSDIEPVMTGGMDNPVDVVFTPGGERIFTTTFLQFPGGGKRDGLIHAVYGGVYGKVWDVIEDHPRTGDVLPPLVHLGAAAPCGLVRLEAGTFGADYQDNVFACLFNMHKVTRHIVQPAGATLSAETSDFLVSDNLDFHPTDILEDADGSLIVVNTGGWYKLCCPTSQLHKPDILGGIYRVKKTGAKTASDPRGLALKWKTLTVTELAKLLDDPRPVVQHKAIAELARRKSDALPLLKTIIWAEGAQNPVSAQQREWAVHSARLRRNALWTVSRLGADAVRTCLLESPGYIDPDPTVLQVAANVLSAWRVTAEPRQVDALFQMFQNSRSLPVRRLAIEWIGRIDSQTRVPKLLAITAQFDSQPDRVLEHACTYALIELADPERTAVGLKAASPATRRVALIALDQMAGGGLNPQMVSELLGSSEGVVKETAAWIVGRHPEWGDALAGYLQSRLVQKNLSDADAKELETWLARFAKSGSVQALIARGLSDASLAPMARVAVLRAVSQSALKETPATWIPALTSLLQGGDAALLEPTVGAVRALPAPKAPDPDLVAALQAVAGREPVPETVRLFALSAIHGGLNPVSDATFELLTRNLRPELDVTRRSTAADILARSRLTTAQLTALTAVFQTAGPLEADRLLPAFKDCADEQVGTKYVDALKASPALTGLRLDAIRASLMKFPPAVHEQAEALYQMLNVNLGKQREKLESLLAGLKDGDIRRGQLVFNSSKAACAACHQFGYLGGNVGPDLTRIGGIRQERDLLEAIVFPSASFVRSYEPIVVVTKSGKTWNGLIKNESTQEILLATGPREEARIARDDIEEIRPSTVSVMPSGLDQQLSPQDLADLIAFLRAAK